MDDINTAFFTDSWLHRTYSIAATATLPHGNLWHPTKAVTHTPTTGDHSPLPPRPIKRTRLRDQATPHIEVAAPTRILPDPHLNEASPHLDHLEVPPYSKNHSPILHRGPGINPRADPTTSL